MAESPLDKYSFKPPQFRDLLDMLGKCGWVVVDNIMRCVRARVKPDMSAQKSNAPSTIIRKGHDHPLVEFRGRFEKKQTYAVTPIDDETVMVSIKSPEDSEIGANLHAKGYEFFGVTPQAANTTDRLMDLYVQEKIIAAFQGKT